MHSLLHSAKHLIPLLQLRLKLSSLLQTLLAKLSHLSQTEELQSPKLVLMPQLVVVVSSAISGSAIRSEVSARNLLRVDNTAGKSCCLNVAIARCALSIPDKLPKCYVRATTSIFIKTRTTQPALMICIVIKERHKWHSRSAS